MNIFAMLWKNLTGRARTLRFPARPAIGSGFRGLVRFNPELCTGCAMCRFRCTARAITFTAGKGDFTWSYDPGHCTFCGRCVDGCKTHALHQDSECPPVYSELGSLNESFTVARKKPAERPPAVAESAQAPPSNGGKS
jgi:formate hydrogenlyase subunit 6